MAVSVLASLARQALQQARDLEANLSPTVLEALGLEPALEALAGQVIRAHGLQVSLALVRLPERLPPQVELALFRLAQDVFDRAIGCVHASQVSVRLERRDERLVLTLSDDGTSVTGVEMLDAACGRIRRLGGTVATGNSPYGGLELTVGFAIAPPVQLTPREMDVIRLLAEGLSNKEIGQRLSLSPRTVNFHLNNIYSKLSVTSRTEAAVYALRHGWGHQPTR
jgi:DNA-binding CsgD family transcriptional regulator